MTFPRGRLAAVALAGALLTASPARSADSPTKPDPQALAARIDAHINARLQAAGVKPAPPANDAAFCRRIYLDLVGRIPSVHEVYDFLNDHRADKRRRLVEKLLESPGYVNHFTTLWSKLLVPEADTNQQLSFLSTGFDRWLRERVRDNEPYDKLVRELLTPPLSTDRRAGRNIDFSNPGAFTFYAAKGYKPENLGAASARLFLGVRLECAQCHNHPFAKWSREQFWGIASFFAGVESQGGNVFAPVHEVLDRRELAIPNTDRVVQASFLDGTEPQWRYNVSSRVIFAEWLTSRSNPYFAREAANRLWGHFFGIGIVEPVDDFTDDHLPSHPAVLDELAQGFIQSGFDLKFLMRTITLTEAYGRSSETPTPLDVRLYAGMPVKGLSGEQIFDSLVQATGMRDTSSPRDRQFFGFTSPRSEFNSKFELSGKRTETPTTILQALTLMNGEVTRDATSLEGSETLTAVLESPFLDTAGRIRTLYLATVSRPPRPEEMQVLARYVEHGPAATTKSRLADVFWALLNSAEFRTNH